ncbi:MAG: asparagine synthase, partial [Thaumarchaeota archaeon]|nr:asparagine synthase [Nitrososphaerota archaeon]
LAAVASDFSKVLAVSVHVEGSHDASARRSSAKALGLDLLEISITEKEVHEKIPWIQKIAEVHSPIDTSIALGMMFASQTAHQESYDTMLVGQLADEIFGGYERYLRTYCSEGASAVRRMMAYDVMTAHGLNFDRDEKAVSPFVDLGIPYANVKLVRFGLSIEPALKFDCTKKKRKIVLRKAAKKFGIPAEIAERPKKAFQYSSGISKAVIRYIRRTS